MIKRNIRKTVNELYNALEDPDIKEAALGAKVLDTAAKLAAFACIMSIPHKQDRPAAADDTHHISQKTLTTDLRPVSSGQAKPQSEYIPDSLYSLWQKTTSP